MYREALYRGKVVATPPLKMCHSLWYCSKDPDQNGVLIQFLAQIQFFLFVQETKFLDICEGRAHAIMTSQMPNAGHIGSLFGICNV